MPPVSRSHPAAAVLFTLWLASLPAQGAQLVQGPSLGATIVLPAGDVDDDGVADYVVDLGAHWEVRSGASGQALTALTRVRATSLDRYRGLGADLDADGHDDLFFQTPGTGTVEYRSGRDGSLLFAFADPLLTGHGDAADHDADGCDDVMVTLDDPVNSVRTALVLSGRNGAVLDAFGFPYTATTQRWVTWVGDVDGDGFVDLAFLLRSHAQPFFTVLAGPDRQRFLAGGNDTVSRGGDTNADGRDELLSSFGYLDAVTGSLVWPGFSFVAAPPMDLDGDGAMDVSLNGSAWSGRTQAAFPGATGVWLAALGDLDGDGRDEAISNGIVYELAGGPPSSRVADRGASGRLSSQSRPRIRHRLRPRLGGTLLVDLHGGHPGGFVLLAIGTAIDLDLAAAGAPGNRAYVDPLALVGRVADAHGLARGSLPVPAAPALLGTALSLQWAVLDRAANPLGLATSNALDVVVGN